jgi:hypothetical protein
MPEHGTMTLGVLIARSDDMWDGFKIKGFCPCAKEISFASWMSDGGGISGLDLALDQIANRLAVGIDPLGEVLLIEAHLDAPPSPSAGCCGPSETAWPSNLPVEANMSTRALIQGLALNYDVTVIEPAGNGSAVLTRVPVDGYEWDPDSTEDDSHAIIVGAGIPPSASEGVPAPFVRSPFSTTNRGPRVDVQAWGASVITTTSGETPYGSFGETSAAAAMIAGVVGILQSVRFEAANSLTCLSPYMRPDEVRAALRDPDFGTEQGDGDHIGPLPDLEKLLPAFCTEVECDTTF